MSEHGRVVLLALDAGDLHLVQGWAAAGELPTVARLLAQGTSAEVVAPTGVFVSALWPTITTGVEPDRHGYLCWDEIDPQTYAWRETSPTPTSVRGTPFWERLSDAGRRVVVLDVPHTWPAPVNGSMVVEWGCHDRHHGTGTWPPELRAEIDALGGPHPVGCAEPPGRDQFAPCDYLNRAGVVRTPEEDAALLQRLRDGVARKEAVSLELLARDDWDVFVSVFGEGHCVGHQLWHVHDPDHPRHDPAQRVALGGDPMLDIYRRIDAAFAAHLACLRPDDQVYVLFSHGMVAHHDGTDVLDPVLARMESALDQPGALGGPTRVAATVAGLLPARVRPVVLRRAAPLVRRRADAAPPAPEGELPARATRRWYAIPNNSVVGAVRLNVVGREGSGRIRPEAKAEAQEWVAARLRELVNVDTGGPVVRDVVVVDDHYRRQAGDQLADLFVEWERGAPIERVWSPSSGTVSRPYRHWRTGDHFPLGLLVTTGPGIAAGVRQPAIRAVDLTATLSAAAGVQLTDVDGSVVPALVAARGGAAAAAPLTRVPLVGSARRVLRRSLAAVEARATRRGPHPSGWEAAPQGDPRVRDELAGLGAAHHDTRMLAEHLERRLDDQQRELRIWRTTAWVADADVPHDLQVSVVLCTHNRLDLLRQAVASVVAQTYPNWQLVVVDDHSVDDTAAYLDGLADPRIVRLLSPGHGVAAARNAGLDAATGDVVVHLDDDNRFAPGWLKAVAWTFGEHPETQVAFGARLIDDDGRHHGRAATGEVGFQLLPWDRAALLEYNRVDTNVLAHRRGPHRIGEDIGIYVDWDLVLSLTAEHAPREIPVVASYYTTHAPDRLTTSADAATHHRMQEAVRDRHRAGP